MPKPKPDNIIRHEIVLGRAERELLDTATTAYTANRVLTPITDVLTSPSGLLTVAAVIGLFLDKTLDPNWREITENMTPNQVNDWLETQNLVGAGIFSFIGFLIGVPFGGVGGIAGAAAGAAAGSAVVEAGEAVAEKATISGLLNLWKEIIP